MKKHVELFNKFGRRFANVADCGKGNIEVDFYEISSGRYGMEISKIVVQYLSNEDFVNVIDRGVIDIYEVGDIFEVMPPISLSEDCEASRILRSLHQHSTTQRRFAYGEIELSGPRQIFIESELKRLCKSIVHFLYKSLD